MTRAAWWHCFSGIAGDMALASLLDAGADLAEVERGLRALPVKGWSLDAAKTTKNGLSATHLRVEVAAEAQAERDWAGIRALLRDAAGLPERARQRATDVFARLALAEGHVHGTDPDEAHFHEVGAVDAIVDVVGTCLALESLGVDHVYASPVALGSGTTLSAHGLLPNPAPAVLALLGGAPVRGTGHRLELTTPTGAALLAGLAEAFGPLPAMTISASGYGAGTADLEGVPNVLQVVIGELEAAPAVPEEDGWAELVVLESNLDDVTGEVLAHTISALLAAGALDAWLVPVIAKKGRPGQVVSVLARSADVAGLSQLLASETGTLGIRQHSVSRWAAKRESLEVQVEGFGVRVKAGPHKLKAEHEDCVTAAAALGLPLATVARRAEDLAAERLRGLV